MDVCHRDIKPSNILVQRGCKKIKITDFNISKICKAEGSKMLTKTGTECFKAPDMLIGGAYTN
jgi:NIMA (never in mitosis gene a)-related kinase